MIDVHLGNPIATTDGHPWNVPIAAAVHRGPRRIWPWRHSDAQWRKVVRALLAWRLWRNVKVRKSQLLLIPSFFHPIAHVFMKLYLTL